MTRTSLHTADTSIRDPRIHPQAGDELRRLDDGLMLKVIKVDDGWIEYQWFSPAGRAHFNRWTLKGWRDVVAKDAKILSAQSQPDSDDGKV